MFILALRLSTSHWWFIVAQSRSFGAGIFTGSSETAPPAITFANPSRRPGHNRLPRGEFGLPLCNDEMILILQSFYNDEMILLLIVILLLLPRFRTNFSSSSSCLHEALSLAGTTDDQGRWLGT